MGVAIAAKNVLRMQDFSKGQNSSDEPSVLPNGFASLLENCLITNVGKIEQRDGLSRVGEFLTELKLSIEANNGAITDSVGGETVTETSISLTTGYFGKAALFNGTGSNITVSGSSDISVNTAGAFRFSTYIKGTTGSVVNKYNSKKGYKIDLSSGEVDFSVGYSTTDAQVITSGAGITASSFVRLDCIHNSDKSLDVYVDGAKCTYATDTTGVGTAGDDTSIDMVIGSGSSFVMDDIKFYDGAFTDGSVVMDKIIGIGRFHVGSTIDRVYRANGTALERLDDDTYGWTILSGSMFQADKYVDMIQAKDKFWFFQGGQNVISMDTSEAFTDEGDTNTDPARGTTAEYMPNNRLYVAGSETVAERDFLWFSDALAPQTFDRSTNVIKVRSGGGGAITKIKKWRQQELVIYKEDSILVLGSTMDATPSNWSLTTLHPSIGCKSPMSVVSLGDEHIFLAEDGVRVLSRTEYDMVRNAVISKPITDIINRINRDQLPKACAAFWDNKYILAVPVDAATENNMVLIYDTQAVSNSGVVASGWTVIPLNTWYPSCFCQFEFSDNTIALLYGDNRDISMVYRAFYGNTDDGAAISMRAELPQHSIDYVHDGVFSPVSIVCDGDSVTEIHLEARIDNDSSWTYIGKIDIDAGGGIDLPVDLPFDLSASGGKAVKIFNTKQLGRGKTFQIALYHNKYNCSAMINEYTVFVSPKGGPIR